MFSGKNKLVFLGLLMILSLALPNFAQEKKTGDGTVSQRLDVMRSKLETMRRSLGSATSVLKDENDGDKSKKDDKTKLDTPLGRLRGLEKDVSKLLSEVNNLRGKIDRSEKYEASEVDQVEEAVSAINSRVDTALLETASARANPESNVGKAREVKKKKKFLGIFGGGGKDEFDELIGEVTPGRDRELSIAQLSTTPLFSLS